MLGPSLLSWFGSTGDRPDVGVALGCAAHGPGTARALEIERTAGTFASVCMGFSGLSHGIALPVLLSFGVRPRLIVRYLGSAVSRLSIATPLMRRLGLETSVYSQNGGRYRAGAHSLGSLKRHQQ